MIRRTVLCAFSLLVTGACSALAPLNANAAPGSHAAHSSFSAVTPEQADFLQTCGGTPKACATAMLGIINHDRAAARLHSLHLKMVQSSGSSGCVGSYGHSLAMARSGTIWHVNTRYPHASFPHNLCVSFKAAGENVGESASGDVLQDLQALDRLMMSEPHSTHVCATSLTHACNILNPAFGHVGIGIYVSNGTTWLTEDFTD